MTELPLHLGVVSDTGQLREANEDAVGHIELDDGLLVVVADGMGGHEAGDVAARITVEAVVAHVKATVGDDPRERLYIGIEHAHTAVREQALRAGTLDDTSWVRPSGHIWQRSKQPWFRPDADDVLCDEQPTDYTPFIERFAGFQTFEEMRRPSSFVVKRVPYDTRAKRPAIFSTRPAR